MVLHKSKTMPDNTQSSLQILAEVHEACLLFFRQGSPKMLSMPPHYTLTVENKQQLN